MSTSRTPLVVMLLAAGLVAVAAAGVSAADEAADLHRLFQERNEWELKEFPESAMRLGDYTSVHRITDNSLSAIERRHRTTVEHVERLRAIDSRQLGEQDLVSHELFDLRLEREIRDHGYRMFLAPIGQRSGPHQTIAMMSEGVRFRTQMDYEHYLTRLEAMAGYVDHAIERMRLGVSEGRTPPKVVLLGVDSQLDALLADGGLDMLAEPFDRLPPHITGHVRDALMVRFDTTAMPAVRDSLQRLRTYFVEDYLPNCRTAIGASTLPDGPAFYAHQLWKMTTTDLDAEAIHALGRSEVARIRGEMMEVIRRSDFLEVHPQHTSLPDDELFRVFIDYLRTDPRFYYEREEDLLTGYRDICKRVDAELPKYFGLLPRTPYGVKKIPDFMAPHQTTAYYRFGSLSNAESGTFYANTYALDQRPKYEMISLAMHEAVPGHHLQGSIARELEDVPEFRKLTWFTAFGEGWALYSERLGIEMKLYEDPYDDFGRLLYEMWRACRLVVDPGMHHLRWTRDQAIEFMRENTALSELNIVNEIDRYIAWPGQACAYKIGELKVRELRAHAEKVLGTGFDLRAFHDVVLGAGSVPLTVLERRVKDWIRSFPIGAAYD
ncbi:MAG: DUF885 domain-containing protein [Planctomycetes bacterium]|nr:DUF885 domain-containing protein [Planctomycetota bacterium]